MTSLTFAQIQKLLSTVSGTVPDSMDCDGCFEVIAELADAEIRGDKLSDAMKAAKVHFSQCTCCAYEYATLLEALDEPESPSL
ncbi:MAG: hypothetical protein JNL58_20245 [Planctomyces sp.]|nr:hypothetical protein [Planctomyces sp.]